jgi:hypothetical protein
LVELAKEWREKMRNRRSQRDGDEQVLEAASLVAGSPDCASASQTRSYRCCAARPSEQERQAMLDAVIDYMPAPTDIRRSG